MAPPPSFLRMLRSVTTARTPKFDRIRSSRLSQVWQDNLWRHAIIAPLSFRQAGLSLARLVREVREYRLEPVPHLAINGRDTGIVHFGRRSEKEQLEAIDKRIDDTQKMLERIRVMNKEAEVFAPRFILRMGYWLERKLQTALNKVLLLKEEHAHLEVEQKMKEKMDADGGPQSIGEISSLARDLERKEEEWKKMRESLRRSK